MAHDLNILQNFLWENYLIDYNKKSLEKLEECSDDEKLEDLKHMVFMNMFLVRRVRDPGFYCYVLERVYEDRSVLSELKRYIENIYDSDEMLFKIHPGDVKKHEKLFDEKINQPITFPDDPYVKTLNDFDEVRKNSLKYLLKRFENAVNANDTNEMRAIESLIHEYSSDVYTGHLLFTPSSPYEGSTYSEYRQYQMHKYALTNIKFFDIYFDNTHQIDLVLHQLTPKTIKLHKHVVENILTDVIGDVKKITESNLLEYNKFINDVISIASVVWFNKKTKEEKKEILNRYYPFSINKDLSDEIFDTLGKVDMLFYLATTLFQKGYLDESKTIYFHTLSKCDDDFCKYTCYENIATTYREQGDFNNALKYYLESLKLLKDLNNESNYKVAIELKNIGETYHQLGKIKDAEAYFSKTEKIMEGLPEKEKIRVLWNLAKSFGRIHDFEKEYFYLSKIIENDGDILGDNLNDAVLNRLGVLSQCIEVHRGGKLNHESLKNIDNQERYENYFRNGVELRNSFQFEDAINLFKQAYEIDNNLNALRNIGISYFIWESYDLAKEYFERIISENPNETYGSVYLGIIKIIDRNIKLGITDISRAINSCFEIGEDYRLLLRVLITNLINIGLIKSLYTVMNQLATMLSVSHEKSLYYNDVATEFTECGLFEEGISYYKKALEGATSSETRSLVLNNIGSNFANQDLHDKAIDYYKQAIEIRQNYSVCWNNMASSYAYQLNFDKAIDCLDKAIKYASQDLLPFFEMQKKVFDLFAQNVLNLNYVEDEKIKQMLYSAEAILLKTNEEKEPLDFSFVLIEYSKALETILHGEIASKIKSKIEKEYGEFIPSKYWNGDGANAPLPFYLRNLIWYKKTISLGSWFRILDEINASSNNPIENEFKAYIKKNFSTEERKIIGEACGKINEFRNSSAHREIKSKSEVMRIRKDIIVCRNKIINIFYKGGKG